METSTPLLNKQAKHKKKITAPHRIEHKKTYILAFITYFREICNPN
jgi:hypothetical protein